MLLGVAETEATSFEVVRSIYSQEMKTITKRNRTRKKVAKNVVVREYLQCAQDGMTMVELAVDHSTTPYTLACSILEGLLDLAHPIVIAREAEISKKAKFSRRRDLVKDLMSTYFADGAPMAGTFPVASEFKVDGWRLHQDVVECILADDTTGPLVDRIRHTVGLEYE